MEKDHTRLREDHSTSSPSPSLQEPPPHPSTTTSTTTTTTTTTTTSSTPTSPSTTSSSSFKAYKTRAITDPITNLREHVRFLFATTPQSTVYSGFDVEYNYIEKVSKKPEFNKPCTVACLPYNFMPKNRYANVLAPDHTRVKLEDTSNDTSDYINANYIRREDDPAIIPYVSAQGPTVNTIPDFWSMIWQLKLRVFVMLTREIEKGIPKCAHYWPDEGTLTFNKISVTFMSETVLIQGELIRRTFKVGHVAEPSNSFILTHFQYTAWPDHGLPVSTKAFIKLSDCVDEANVVPGSSVVPSIGVHCSAGIGRSGTFCTVHTVLSVVRNHFKTHSSPPPLNLVNTVLWLRRQRPGMVQTKEQFMFCYLAVLEEYTRLWKEARARKKGLKEKQSANGKV